MVIHGQIQNGIVVPEGVIPLPDGTKVTITVNAEAQAARAQAASVIMSPERQIRYADALQQIDAVASENPDDSLSGKNHDQALYGDEA